MKDVVETLLTPGAHHLALAVPHRIHGRSPYYFAVNLISALYAVKSRNDTSEASSWSGTNKVSPGLPAVTAKTPRIGLEIRRFARGVMVTLGALIRLAFDSVFVEPCDRA